jgi:WD40 repeat protein
MSDTTAVRSRPVSGSAERRPVCPYVGLVPFDEADEAYFFGRERERDLVVANLTAARLTILYAASGVGKSSLLRASVLPLARHLTQEALEDLGSPGAATAYVSEWTDSPLDTVATAIADAVARVTDAATVRQGDRLKLTVPWLRATLEQSGIDAIHLILDQFEEYFLYHSSGGAADAFDEVLSEILNARDLRVNVLLSIREDGLATLGNRFKGRIPHLLDNYLQLSPLDRHAARRAIEEPLKRYNLVAPVGETFAVEPELVDSVLDQVQVGRVVIGGAGAEIDLASRGERDGSPSIEVTSPDGEIEAPYLQLVLTRLWREERAADSNVLQFSTLERLGGAQTIVRTHLDEVMGGLSHDQRVLAAAVFRHVVTSSGSKIALTADDLAELTAAPVDPVRELLDTLCSGARILRPVPPAAGLSGPPRYEIYHDVMGAAVVDWRRRFVAEQVRAQAERQLVQEREEARAAEAAARRRLRRTAALAGVMAVALVLAAVLGFWAYQSEQDAKRSERSATQHALLAEAAALFGTRPAESLSKAVEAFELEPNADAQEAVLAAASAPRSTILGGRGQDFVGMEVTADERRIVAWDAQGATWIFDIAGSTEPTHYPAPRLSGRVSFYNYSHDITPDGGRLAFATTDGEIVAIDLGTGASVRLPSVEGDPAIAVVSSGQVSDFVVVSPPDSNTEIYDAQTGRRVGAFTTSSYLAEAAPDGRHVITADYDGYLRVWDPSTLAMRAQSPQSLPELVGASTDDPGGFPLFIKDYRKSVVAVTNTHIVRWDWLDQQQFYAYPTLLSASPTIYDVDIHLLGDDEGWITIAYDKTVDVYELSSGEGVGRLPPHADWVYDVTTTSEQRWFATAGGDGRISIWSRYLPNRPTYDLLGHQGAVLQLTFAEDDASLVSLGNDGTIRLWKMPDVNRYDQHGDWVLDLDVNADQRLVVTASRDGSAAVVSADDISAELARIYPSAPLTAATFSPIDPHMVIILGEYGSAPELWRWNDETGVDPERIAEFDSISPGFLLSIDVSPDGKTVASGDTVGHVYLWDASTGKLRDELDAGIRNPVTDVIFDSDGSRLAAVTDNGARVWTLTGEAAVIDLPTADASHAVFDDENGHIAVASERGHIDIWADDAAQEPLTTVRVRGGRLGRPTMSDDGKFLAVGTAEGLIEVVETDSWRTVMVSRVHGDSVNSVEFQPGDVSHIISASDDTTVADSRCAACENPDDVIKHARSWASNAEIARDS